MHPKTMLLLCALTLASQPPSWAEQRITLTSQTLVPGGVAYVRAYYTTDDTEANRTGIAFNLHWSSAALTFYELSGIQSAPFQWQGGVQPDTQDLDGDATTDRYLPIGWYDPSGEWPDALERPQMLFYIGFNVSSDFTGETPLNLVPVSSAPTTDGGINGVSVESIVLSTEPPAPTYRLSVAKAGTGAGRVSGDSIDCGNDCSETYPETTPLSLTASPDAGSRFTGWSGDCSGTGACALTMDADKRVTATFDLRPPEYGLEVARTGNGSGRVTGEGIDCGSDCRQTYLGETPVSLTATADPGALFTGWSGACTGGGVCAIQMTQDLAVAARFTTEDSHTCQSDMATVTGPRLQGTQLIRSETRVVTNGPVTLEATADVTFEASQQILLDAGFRTEPGGHLTARITPVECAL